jgi:hypothetical protein
MCPSNGLAAGEFLVSPLNLDAKPQESAMLRKKQMALRPTTNAGFKLAFHGEESQGAWRSGVE